MFWYVATPFTKYPRGACAAYRMACRETGNLMLHGIPAFSPIAHTWGLHCFGRLGKQPHGYWLAIDGPMMDAAHGLIVIRATGWDTSAGVKQEIDAFHAAGKPVLHCDPGQLPLTIGQGGLVLDPRINASRRSDLFPRGHPASPWTDPVRRRPRRRGLFARLLRRLA